MKRLTLLSLIFLFLNLSPLQPGADQNGWGAKPAMAMTHLSHPTTLQDVSSLSAAVVDPSTGQLMLVGGSGGSAINLDDFVVALRVIYAGEYPAVSIDPGSDNNAMNVVYFGGIEDTHLGFVLYEADRLLKSYSLGVDNLTGQAIVSGVPGYQSELALARVDAGGSSEPVWHRSWFEPAQLTSPAPAGPGGRRGVSLDGLGVVLKTEYISIDGSPIPGEGSDPAAEQFVNHFNANFGAFAGEQPALQELVQIRRWLYLARWLRDENVPVAAEWLAREVEVMETPGATPRVNVSRDEGGYRLILGGGVDFTQQNAYPESNPFVEALADTLLNLPPAEREGTVSVQGQNLSVTVINLYDTASYSQVDAEGNTWHFATDDGRLLSTQNPKEGVTNFDAYNESGQLVRKTINYADGVVELPAVGTGAVGIVYHTEAAAQKDLLALLSIPDPAQSGQNEILESSPGQQTTYQHLRDQGQLSERELQALSVPGGGQVSVLPLMVGDEAWAVISGNAEPMAIPESDVVVRSGEGANTVLIVRGVTGVQFFSRARVSQLSNETAQFVFPFEVNGQLYFQAGQNVIPLPDQDQDTLFEEGNQGGAVTALQPLREAMVAETVILFSGSGFPNSVEGEAYEASQREFNQNLTRLLISGLDMANVQSDDEAEEALNNLAAQEPLVNDAGEPDLSVIIDADSLTGEENENEIASIQETLENASVPVETDLTAELPQNNLMVITGQEDSEVEASVLPQLGANDNLQDRYLILLVVGQEQADRSYVRLVIIDYGAAGVLVNDGQIALRSARHMIEALTASPAGSQGIRPPQAIIQAVQTLLANPDLDEQTRSEMEEFYRSLVAYLSRLPGVYGVQ